MVDDSRQVPTPSGAAWLFDLAHIDGPPYLVLRQGEADARACLSEHLAELGVVRGFDEAMTALAVGRVEHAGVLW